MSIMKVVVEICGDNAADGFFKNVVRLVYHDLELKGLQLICLENTQKSVDLIFQCLKSVEGTLQDVDLVTVYHTEPKNEAERLFLQALEQSILGQGKKCFFASYDNCPKL